MARFEIVGFGAFVSMLGVMILIPGWSDSNARSEMRRHPLTAPGVVVSKGTHQCLRSRCNHLVVSYDDGERHEVQLEVGSRAFELEPGATVEIEYVPERPHLAQLVGYPKNTAVEGTLVLGFITTLIGGLFVLGGLLSDDHRGQVPG